MTLYFKLTDEQLKALHCPANTWFAVWGIPPNLEARSSTHLYEFYSESSLIGTDVVLKLAKLSGQDDFIVCVTKELGEKRVKELLEYKPIGDVDTVIDDDFESEDDE